MKYSTHHPKRWFAGSIGAIAVIAMVAMTVGLGAATAANNSATAANKTVSHARPDANLARTSPNMPNVSIPVTSFHQEFTSNTQYFCDGNNAPCDGNGGAGDYGTIDRVTSNTANGAYSNGGFGNYAPFTKALHDNGGMAVVSGTGDVNQGQGCPGTTPTSNPGEACTGPFALFGLGNNAGAENVFPNNGFTVTNDLYLSASTAPVAGSLVDDDVELNNSSGGFGIDNVTTVCYEGGGVVFNFGNGSPGSCSGTPVTLADGWYRFVDVFSNVAGNAYVTESVLNESNSLAVVATSGSLPVGGTPSAISNWGGPGYFWLPSEDMSGLPLDNFALQLGTHPTGYTPSP